jgi:hypothetical protein
MVIDYAVAMAVGVTGATKTDHHTETSSPTGFPA